MVDKFHGRQKVANGLHGIVALEYADQTARLAAGPFHDYDLYKVAIEQDSGKTYVLISFDPIVWQKAIGTAVDGTDGEVLTTAGTDYVWAKITDNNIDSAANIDVSKLAGSDDGYLLVSEGGVPEWQTPPPTTPSGPAGGDLSGTYPNPLVHDLTITGETQGSVLYFDGSNWVRLSPSTDGYVLTTHSTGANPTWTGVSTDIANGSIGLSKLANGNALSVIGRSANSAGVYADITGTTDQVLRVNTAGTTLGFGSIATAGITNNAVTLAKLATQSALSVLANATNATAVPTAVAAGSDAQVFLRSGTSLAFGTVATAGITDAAITYAKITNGTGLSVIGRSANTSGVNADITGTDGQALRVSGTSLGFGTLATAAYANSSVTLAKIANGTALSVLGVSGSSGAAYADIAGTADQVLRVNSAGTAVGFGTIATSGLTDGSITMAKLADLAGLSVIGRSANTSGVPAAVTATVSGQTLTYNGTSIGWTDPNFQARDITTTGNINLGTTPSTTGVIRLPNATNIRFRNSTNDGNLDALAADSSNNIILGDTADTCVLVNNNDSVILQTAGSTKLTVNTSVIQSELSTIQFNSTVSAPVFAQATNANNGITGQVLTIHAQNASGTTTTGGILDLRSGTGTTNAGNLTLRSGSTVKMSITPSLIEIDNATFRFDSTVSSPTFLQDDNTTASATAQTLTIHAANATSSGATGGQLIISSGTGTSADGYWTAKTGSTTFLNATTTALEIGDISLPMIEVTTLFANRDIISLCAGTTLTTTQMPANTGDQVIYLGVAATAPSANPVSGGIIYSRLGEFSTRDTAGKMTLGDGYCAMVQNAATGGFTYQIAGSKVLEYVSYAAGLNFVGTTSTVTGINVDDTPVMWFKEVDVSCDISFFVQNPNFNSGDGIMYVGNYSSKPVAAPASGCYIYSAAGALTTRNSSDIISTL